jgi:hypothetical protein
VAERTHRCTPTPTARRDPTTPRATTNGPTHSLPARRCRGRGRYQGGPRRPGRSEPRPSSERARGRVRHRMAVLRRSAVGPPGRRVRLLPRADEAMQMVRTPGAMSHRPNAGQVSSGPGHQNGSSSPSSPTGTERVAGERGARPSVLPPVPTEQARMRGTSHSFLAPPPALLCIGDDSEARAARGGPHVRTHVGAEVACEDGTPGGRRWIWGCGPSV